MDSESETALRDYITQCEGTTGQRGWGYSTSLDYGKWLPGGKEQDLTVLTLDQIEALQLEMLSHPENATHPGGGSSAIGRNQIVRRTLKGLRAQLRLSGAALRRSDAEPARPDGRPPARSDTRPRQGVGQPDGREARQGGRACPGGVRAWELSQGFRNDAA
ncbi:hypothetical protein FHT86_003529 [Rhizobium sp. BK313]|uniref:hypothetical protein n=1 Tax=Rhizobium sp. BK313 TaxID=2587081 RepID=UPI0010621AC7|nr:hypothetical protein [Rhizobium sp. BK313]MBB3455230.1 hypothetical protein [Rhizobium sp. BK313]